MANGFLLRWQQLGSFLMARSSATNGISASFPLVNLNNPQPKVVAQTGTGAGGFQLVIDLDFGSDVSIDTCIVMHTNLSTAADWQVYGSSFASGDLPASGTEPAARRILGFTGFQAFGVAPTTRQRRRHAVAVSAAPAAVRWVRIYLRDSSASNIEQMIRVGTIGLGKRLEPVFNFELGSGRKVLDRSSMRDLPGGEIGGLRGAKVPVTRVTWGDMTDAELRDLWSLLLDVGESEPVFLVEDPDPTTGQCERIHYGTLQGLDFYERIIADKSKIEARLKEWL